MVIGNILQFYGSKLDLKIDDSEFYDFEIGNDDVRLDLINFTTGRTIDYECLIINSNCFNTLSFPKTIKINEFYSGGTCNFTVRNRTEKGWTLSFLFDKSNLNWESGVFYYLGLKNDNEPSNYLDNNLSFGFTDSSEILWKSHHYSGVCNTVSGYTTSNYILTGKTTPISGITNNKFHVVITFERNIELNDCNLLNDGGINDLITGLTITNPYDVLTGTTQEIEYVETLNKMWVNSRNYRLGTLKIYINGQRIYKINNWEEIIPSQRNSSNDLVQVWGGGDDVTANGIHTPNTNLQLINFRYFECPLNFVYVKNLYFDINNSLIIPYITPTPSKTPTRTPTPTVTPTISVSATVTPTRTVTPSISFTPTLSISSTPTVTPTKTVSPSLSISVTPSITLSTTPSVTPTLSVSGGITSENGNNLTSENGDNLII